MSTYTMKRESGIPTYFGVGLPDADDEGYQTTWIKVTFSDGTYVRCANEDAAKSYAETYGKICDA